MKIAISAGETSGDQHAARLVQAIQRTNPAVVFRGMGGRSLREAGVDTIVDAETSASVMGFFAVLSNIRSIVSAFSAMKQLLNSWKPDLLLIVDFADFNLRLAKQAKRNGIPVFYYIPPKVWAWREGRVKSINKYVDAAAVIFPFEESFLRRKGFDAVQYVGHPFADNPRFQPASEEWRQQFFEQHRLDSSRPLITVFPGSRKKEIESHMPIIVKGLTLLRKKQPHTQILISLAPGIEGSLIQRHIQTHLPVAFFRGDSLDALKAGDVGLIKSGTSNLEAALVELPFVMFYKGSAVTEFFIKRLTAIDEYSLVNIIGPQTVSELVGLDARAERIAEELELLLTEEPRRQKMIEAFRRIRTLLRYTSNDTLSAPDRAALIACQLVEESKTDK